MAIASFLNPEPPFLPSVGFEKLPYSSSPIPSQPPLKPSIPVLFA